MQFISHKISTGRSKSFDQIVDDYLKNKNSNVKTSSVVNANVKIAKEETEGKSSGQLEVEPLHQKGESTNQDSVAGGKKDEGGKKTTISKPDEEGKDSGQPKAEGKLTNDPKKEASEAVAETKEAGIKGTCEKCSKPNFLCKCDGKVKDKVEDKKEDKPEDKKEDKKEDKPEDKKEDKKEATKKMVFKKVANLTSQEKTKLKDYWKNLFPVEFVDAMLADK